MRRIAGYAMTFCAFAFLSLSAVGVVSAQPATSDTELNQAAENAKPPIVITTPAPAPEPVVTAGDGLIAGFLVLLGWVIKLCAPMLNSIGENIGIKAKAEDLLNDAKWRNASKDISRTALNWALTAFKVDPKWLENVGVRASILRHANDWIVRQYGKPGDYLEWVDQDRNGQIDFLEGVLADAALLPAVDHSQPPKTIAAVTTAPTPAAPPAAA